MNCAALRGFGFAARELKRGLGLQGKVVAFGDQLL